MMNIYKYWQDIEGIIDEALELEEEFQEPFIKKSCSHNPDLLNEALDYYTFIKKAEDCNFLNSDYKIVSDLITDPEFSTDIQIRENVIGATIGAHQITELIGEGGMGSVYLAERIDGEFDQKVAIKFLRGGFFSSYLRKRFINEKRILARLNHPNITRLLDGGIADDGTPYLTMEYVDGLPVDEYCKKKKLDVNARLNLFLQICDAVQFAHTKLVIHRDLKPQNILVTDDGQIKIMDFGIAKFLNPDAEEMPPLQTREGQFIASFKFAAPEQIRAEDPTVATDVYGLGSLLYLLLTEEHPHQFDDHSIGEIKSVIQHQAPARPGRIEKKDIGPIYSDLEAIILKALQKTPSDRYNSVTDFSNDIRRFLNHHPVLAKRRSNLYKLKKFLIRNRTPLAAVFTFIFIISVFLLYHFWALDQKVREAEFEAARANQITEFMTDLFSASDPYLHDYTEGNPTVMEVLERALISIETELADDAELYSELQSVIGNSLYSIGQYNQAKNSINASLNIQIELHGNNDIALLPNILLLAQIYNTEALRDSALYQVNRAMDIYINSDDSNLALLADIYNMHGLIHAHKMEYAHAQAFYEIVLDLYSESEQSNSVDKASTLSKIANVQLLQQNFDEAESNLYDALEILKNELGDSHITIANIYGMLGSLYRLRSNFIEAVQYYTQALDLKKFLLAENHPSLITSYNNLGLALQQMGRHEEAIEHFEKSIHIFKLTEQTDSLRLGITLSNLALAKMSLEKYDEAMELHSVIYSIKTEHLDANSPSITLTLYNKAHLHHQLNNLDQAQTMFEEVLERDIEHYGPDHPEIAVNLVKLGAVYRDAKKFEKAEESFSRAEIIFYDSFPETHFRVGEFYLEYGRLKKFQQNCTEAIPFIQQSLAIFEKFYDEDHNNIITARNSLSDCRTIYDS